MDNQEKQHNNPADDPRYSAEASGSTGTAAVELDQPAKARRITYRKKLLAPVLTMATNHVFLLMICCVMILPFIWMVLASLKPFTEVEAPNWIPTDWRPENYLQVFKALRYGALANEEVGHWTFLQYLTESAFVRYYYNSLLVAGCVTLLQCLTSSMAAYAFSRLKWPGRDKVFLLYLATMMIPGLVLMIPNYQIMMRLGWIDSYIGLIIPAAFTAFGTFLMRQFMMSIPSSLDEAAEIDGASKWQIFWEVIMPLSRPGLIVLCIFTFMGTYKSFFWPLVMLRTQAKYTLPVGLLFFDSSQGTETQLLMAAVTMSVVPLIILFIILQKYLVKGIQLGAVKG